MLQLNSLTKIYSSSAQKLKALNNVSFSVNEGDYLAIVGPSGSGKSTLLHIAGGLDTPTSGTVLFEGTDIYQMKNFELAKWRNTHIGFVFQFYHLIEELNVIENVAIAAFAYNRKYTFKKAQELLKYLGIEERKNFYPSQLSGGEKQKVAIARALINDPKIILCDEPTGSLDKDSQNKVVELLEQLNKEMKKTVIIVTHNTELAKKAQKIITLKAGELVN